VVVPVVADAHGANGTSWLTDLRLHAPEATDETLVHLFLVPSGTDGTSSPFQASIRLPAGRVASLPDLVSSWFGQRGLSGALVIESDPFPVQVSSRTYNSGGTGGTFGQFIGAVRQQDTISSGDPPLHALFLADTADYRSNLGLVEVAGQPASVLVTAFDGATGQQLADPRLMSLAPFSQMQVNRFLPTVGGGGLANARAAVTVVGGAGRVAAYTSLVDNRTGDAALVTAGSAEPVEQLVVPVVARTPGAAGTRWASELRVANLGPERVAVDVELRWHDESEPRTATRRIEIAGGAVAASDDVVGSLLGVESAVGSLRIVPVGGPARVEVASRTYNRTSEGTFGQAVPAVVQGSTGPVEVLHLDGHGSWRSNLGLCEVSGGDALLAVELFDGNGTRVGDTRVVELEPYQQVQIDRVHDQLGAPSIDNCRAVIRRDRGDGLFVVYGSVVDGRTGDAIFVPAAAHSAD
jgi:hypothetical protein